MAGMSWFLTKGIKTELVKRSVRHQPGDGICSSLSISFIFRCNLNYLCRSISNRDQCVPSLLPGEICLENATVIAYDRHVHTAKQRCPTDNTENLVLPGLPCGHTRESRYFLFLF